MTKRQGLRSHGGFPSPAARGMRFCVTFFWRRRSPALAFPQEWSLTVVTTMSWSAALKRLARALRLVAWLLLRRMLAVHAVRARAQAEGAIARGTRAPDRSHWLPRAVAIG